VEVAGKYIWALSKASVQIHSEGSLGAFERVHATSPPVIGAQSCKLGDRLQLAAVMQGPAPLLAIVVALVSVVVISI